MTGFAHVAVIGAGTMGHALALVHALAGCTVRLQDSSPEALARAPQLIASALETLVAGAACTGAEAEAAAARVTVVPALPEAVAGADLVVEAVVEDREVKRAVYAAIEAAAPADAVLASNSSYLDIFPLAPAGMAPRTMIVHWYTPPYIVDLVDVVPGPGTDPALVERMRDFLAGIGKQPIVFRQFTTGFIANRLQSALHNEIFAMLDEGLVSPADIDRSIIHGLAARMALIGVVMKADYTGLDMMRRALANGTFVPAQPKPASPTLDRLIAQGRDGVMSGAGFYDYGGRDPAVLFRQRDAKLLELRRVMRALNAGNPAAT
jgi:3-hydroxybutyryl-CoA dehydrogenase